VSLPKARLLQLLGLIVALVGLFGYWFSRDVKRTELPEPVRELIGTSETPITFVVAGRDIHYDQGKSYPIYNNRGQIVRWEYTGKTTVYGTNTDTILYVSMIGKKATMLLIPRDIYLPNWDAKINSMYAYQNAEGLKRSVEQVVGLPADYHAIINLDIFKNIVDALGGVEVYIAQEMKYRDNAAGLEIDFPVGLRHLDGEDAAKFVRFRELHRGDIDRLDNVKVLANAMLKRMRELNLGLVVKLPQLVDTLFKDIETNASPALIKDLLPRLAQLELVTATLPTTDTWVTIQGDRVSALDYDPQIIENFLAQTFGGTAREFTVAPEASLVISNRSGEAELGERYQERLVALGIPETSLLLRDEEVDAIPTRILATYDSWQDADYYSDLLGLSKQQIDRISFAGEAVGLELVLGEDAAKTYFHQPLKAQRRSNAAITADLP
jgi:LCP family protein required for cell wall assembly